MTWVWIALGVALAGAGGFVYWRRRRQRQHRLVALVGLLREPARFDPAVLARVAGKAWNADLGDGASEGADGFVVGVDVMNTIMHDGRMFLVNCFPRPYVEDVEAAAEGIRDLRIRGLFRQHAAWFSCDALGVDGATPADAVLDWYRRLARLFVELLDDNCLLIYLPDSQLAFPINEDTEKALRADDPVAALRETLEVPILEVPDDDPLVQQAVATARQKWPEFVAAYEAGAGKLFSVKAPVTAGGNTEFIWITVTSLEGDRIYGQLANEPGSLGDLRLDSKVSVPVADLNDWCYVDAQEKLVGGFSIQAVQKASQRRG